MKIIKSTITDNTVLDTISKTGLLINEQTQTETSLSKEFITVSKNCCSSEYLEHAKANGILKKAV